MVVVDSRMGLPRLPRLVVDWRRRVSFLVQAGELLPGRPCRGCPSSRDVREHCIHRPVLRLSWPHLGPQDKDAEFQVPFTAVMKMQVCVGATMAQRRWEVAL